MDKQLKEFHVSATQLNLYQECQRKWAWAYIEGHKPQSVAQLVGVKVHELLEKYLKSNVLPDLDELLQPLNSKKYYPVGKIALRMISTLPHLSKRESFCYEEVENSFDRKIKGINFVGKLDYTFLDQFQDLFLWDHKTSSDPIKWGKTADQLKNDLQAILYSYILFLDFDHDSLEFTHHYGCTNKNNLSNLKNVSVVFNRKEVTEKFENIIYPLAKDMKVLYNEQTNPLELPANVFACSNFGGCDHHLRCAKNMPTQKGIFGMPKLKNKMKEMAEEAEEETVEEENLKKKSKKRGPKPKLKVKLAPEEAEETETEVEEAEETETEVEEETPKLKLTAKRGPKAGRPKKTKKTEKTAEEKMRDSCFELISQQPVTKELIENLLVLVYDKD